MIRQTLTKMELEATVTAMAERDFGSEIMLEIVEDLEMTAIKANPIMRNIKMKS